MRTLISSEQQRFPGEGRGPVAEQQISSVALSYINLRYWTPAFAGEAQQNASLEEEKRT